VLVPFVEDEEKISPEEKAILTAFESGKLRNTPKLQKEALT
jgi:hypothetical protein